MKAERSTIIPLILAIYLVVMATIGYKDYADGRTSPLFYFGTIVITALILVLLHFSLKRRERLRRERLNDMEQNSGDPDK